VAQAVVRAWEMEIVVDTPVGKVAKLAAGAVRGVVEEGTAATADLVA